MLRDARLTLEETQASQNDIKEQQAELERQRASIQAIVDSPIFLELIRVSNEAEATVGALTVSRQAAAAVLDEITSTAYFVSLQRVNGTSWALPLCRHDASGVDV